MNEVQRLSQDCERTILSFYLVFYIEYMLNVYKCVHLVTCQLSQLHIHKFKHFSGDKNYLKLKGDISVYGHSGESNRFS